jgi:hypothetical protein
MACRNGTSMRQQGHFVNRMNAAPTVRPRRQVMTDSLFFHDLLARMLRDLTEGGF